ncbi:hypothetical protein DFH28DRAFT_1094268, partial [Melampsora americana]
MSYSVLLILISIGSPWFLLYLFHLRIDLFPSRRQLSGSRSSFDTIPITFDTGFGWFRFHTQRFNRTSSRLLKSLGVIEVSSGPDPKSFDPEPLLYRDRKDGPSSRRVHKALVMLYDVGTILILILQLFAIIILAFLFLQIVHHTIFGSPHRTLTQTNSTIPVSERIKGLIRRSTSFEPLTVNKPVFRPERSSRFSLKPLIPGLTIPLDQAPIYLSALFLSQAYHEFGHAFVAALNDVPMISSGFILAFPFFPIFYVSILPILSSTFHPNSQFLSLLNLRMATAGVWHNVIMASIGWVFWNEGADLAGYLFRLTGGWEDVGNLGVGVISVQERSSISSVLLTNEIITDLNDFSLSSLSNSFYKSPVKKWERFLISDFIWLKLRSKRLVYLEYKCCQAFNEQETEPNELRPICFKSRYQSGCINPKTVSKMMEDSIRCETDQECQSKREGENCVRPDEESNLLRLKVSTKSPNGSYSTRTVLVSRFKTGNLRKRPMLDIKNYLISISIGIGFVNLLPIKRLDGSTILNSLIHFHTSNTIKESELGRGDLEISDEIDEYNSYGHIKPNLLNYQTNLIRSLQNSFSNMRFGKKNRFSKEIYYLK